jgi:hypothetical protein
MSDLDTSDSALHRANPAALPVLGLVFRGGLGSRSVFSG